MHILSIQHAAHTPLGTLGAVIAERGGIATTIRAAQGEALPESHTGFDGIVLLGGPMSAADDAGYPHFSRLLELARGFHDAGKPALGLCLGAQLLARAFGKPVYRHDEREIGFTALAPTIHAASDPLLAGLAPVPPIMEWHEDTFELPEGATLLLTGEACLNQAFRVAPHSYGFQCHWETTREIIEAWVAGKRDWLATRYPAILAGIEDQLARHIDGQREFARAVSGRWLDLVAARKQASREAERLSA